MRPVQYAVYRGSYDIFKFVLECNDADIENQIQSQMSLTGSTLLHLSAFRGSVGILNDLLERNLNPFQQNRAGDTSLHLAIRRNHLDWVLAFVRWCVQKNYTAARAEIENSAECQTPFMTAVLRERFEIADLLLKNNLATKGYVNREGRSVHQIAEDQNKTNAIAYLGGELHSQKFKRDGSVNKIGTSLPATNRRGSPSGVVTHQ